MLLHPRFGAACLMVLAALPFLILPTAAQSPPLSEEQKAMEQKLGNLRSLPEEERGRATRQLALDIRKLSEPAVRVLMAAGLTNLATEGDYGHDTLQEVGTTLADALRVHPEKETKEGPDYSYVILAQLVRYEGVKVSLNDPQFTAALAKLEADDRKRQQADFTLKDLEGKTWTLKALRGKVVLVNFWATWCPPCRKELPDLEALYKRFKDRGLVVLGISDETLDKVQPFVARQGMTYPVLLDPGRKINTLFEVSGIPRSLIYDRKGKLAAEAIDQRTERQLLALLARAGLK